MWKKSKIEKQMLGSLYDLYLKTVFNVQRYVIDLL